MKNTLRLTITAACLVMAIVQSGLGQQGSVPTSLAAAEESTTREQDGLHGPVRRVRVETARIVVKGDKMAEGPRVVRGVATYDPLGKKIDAVDYPLESNTVPGKEKYRYDDKGNIIEMVVVGSDGSILGKEAYDYELDPMGNWTKMNTAVAVYENGKVTFEPTEVTYRTISYYYNQAIEKISKTTAKTKSAAQPSTPAPVSAQLNTVKAVAKPIANNLPVAEKVAAVETAVNKPASVPTTPIRNSDSAGPETSTIKEAPAAPANTAKPNVIKFEENVLRSAAIDLPQPEYPQTALITRAAGPVEVQLLVNEKGVVTNARGQSGNPLLIPAAEAAALKARFSPSKLSADPTIAFGVITYNFLMPEAPSPTATNPSESKPRPAGERKVAPTQSVEKNALAATATATFTEAQPKKLNPESDSSHYSRGVAFLTAGNYEEAAMALNQAVQANPNDANAYLRLAQSYSGLNKDKEAIAGYKMAKQIERSVFDAPAYFSWGRSYLAIDKNSDAISAFKQALSLMRAEAIGLEPKTSASVPSLEHVHHHLGVAYINARRFSDAIKEFKQVVALNPANAEAHYALAISYLNTDDPRAAQDEHRILGSLDPEMAKKLSAAISEPTARMGCRNIGCQR